MGNHVVTNLHLPRWSELPNLDLYLDQLVTILEKNLKDFICNKDDTIITKTMINNYVKSGALPHPEKKKYKKEHLAALMAICMLKQVLALQDIVTLLDGQELDQRLYGEFLSSHTGAVRETCRQLSESSGSKEELLRTALRLAAQANAQRAAAERILKELADEEKA